MESIAIKHLHGVAKVMGSLLGVSGALVFAFVKGAPLKVMNWYQQTHHRQKTNSSSSTQGSTIGEQIKGPLIMLLANTAWSLWLILQVHESDNFLFSK